MADGVIPFSREVAVAEKLPAPPIPAEVDLRNFPYTPFFRTRFLNSAFNALTSDAEWRLGVVLILKSQDQAPSGSLPDDEVELCRLGEHGRDLNTFRKLRVGALRGWKRHSDGRLYHKVVTEIVLQQWQAKLDQRNRTLRARIAAMEKRLSRTGDEGERADLAEQIARLRQGLSQTSVTDAVTETVTASKGEGEGIDIPPNPHEDVGGSDQSEVEAGRRPSRASGTTKRQIAQRAAAEAEARQAAERRAASEAQWSLRLDQFEATDRWGTAWGRPPSTNPAIKEDGVFLPPSLWARYREIMRQRETIAAQPKLACDVKENQ